MVRPGEFDWLDDSDEDETMFPETIAPDGLADDYDATEKFGWEMSDIGFSDPDSLNDWTGIVIAPRDRERSDASQDSTRD